MATAEPLRGRFDIRVSDPIVEERLRAAAELTHEPVSRFILDAAQERADEVLAGQTEVPAAYFSELVRALEAPPESIPRIAAQAARPRRFTWRG